VPCPLTGGWGQGQGLKTLSKKFAGPDEGAAEGPPSLKLRTGKKGFREARQRRVKIPSRPSDKISEFRVRILPKIGSDFVQSAEQL